MNNNRRKMIRQTIQSIEKILNEILSEEEDAFDNMPENLQYSERGEASQEAQENLQDAIDALEEAVSYLEDIV